MNYYNFKKLLNKNNIILYDGNARIIHWKFNKLFNLNQTNIQIGGNINNYKIIINKLNKKNLIRNLIDSLIDDNINRTNYILKLIN